MAYVTRKPFMHLGTKYQPGDVVKGFPEEFNRSEGFIRGGFVVEDMTVSASEPVIFEMVVPEAPKQRRRKPAEVVPTEE